MSGAMEGGCRLEGGDAGGRRFLLDRSKIRVLLCDKDYRSSQEILHLLCKCSYQVTTVRTARQVIDMLTTQGTEFDIILAEVDLPIAKGFKMLKCIARKKELRRIPIIMMSSQDEVSVVVKCLRLGAADYLVKPLRTNELLNLWTHTWRRRRMLGFAEKDIFNQEVGLVLTDPSDANTNSTTLLSEDTDDKTRTTHQEVTIVDQREHESNISPTDPIQNILAEKEVNSLQDADHAGKQFNAFCSFCCLIRFLSYRTHEEKQIPVFSGRIFSWPKKTDLKVGESSAFFTYVKSSAPTSNSHFSHVDRTVAPLELLNGEDLLVGGNIKGHSSRDIKESHSQGNAFLASENVSTSSTLQAPMEFPIACYPSHNTGSLSRTEGQIDVPGMQAMFHVPIYLHGQTPSVQGFQEALYDLHMQNATSFLPQYNILSQSHYAPTMQYFSYHPVGINLLSSHTHPAHQWQSFPSSNVPEAKSGPMERRAAAIMKFKQKKKNRCYDKKIRYVNRKWLAEKRPRVRGQFVRQVNGIDVKLEDFPVNKDSDSEEEEEEPSSRNLESVSSPEHDASEC